MWHVLLYSSCNCRRVKTMSIVPRPAGKPHWLWEKCYQKQIEILQNQPFKVLSSTRQQGEAPIVAAVLPRPPYVCRWWPLGHLWRCMETLWSPSNEGTNCEVRIGATNHWAWKSQPVGWPCPEFPILGELSCCCDFIKSQWADKTCLNWTLWYKMVEGLLLFLVTYLEDFGNVSARGGVRLWFKGARNFPAHLCPLFWIGMGVWSQAVGVATWDTDHMGHFMGEKVAQYFTKSWSCQHLSHFG